MLELRTQLKLKPELILTPQLRLSLKILQLNRLELIQYLRNELEANPLLELEGPKDLISVEELGTEPGSYEEVDPWESLFDAEAPSPYPSFAFEEKEVLYWEAQLKKEEGLYDHLIWQVSLAGFSEKERTVAEYIVQNLNERGYLVVKPEEIAEELGVELELVERVRERIKFFDPVGVASVSIEECLLAQLKYLGLDGSLAERIVREHFRDIVKGEEYLAKRLGVRVEEVRKAVEVIKGLEPFPGRAFATETTLYVEPDIIFYKEGGRWRARLYEEGLPRLRLNFYYRKLLSDPFVSREAKLFIREKLRSAEWLIKSLDHREKTLVKVAEVIADFQKDFLEKGPAHLKPLTLKEVAERVGVHESTVSRVTHNKYAETPHGTYELKFFFPSGIRDVSSQTIKEYIKELIGSEDPKRPYTDQELSKLLEERYGVKVARRTVAKYREALGYPSARARKKLS